MGVRPASVATHLSIGVCYLDVDLVGSRVLMCSWSKGTGARDLPPPPGIRCIVPIWVPFLLVKSWVSLRWEGRKQPWATGHSRGSYFTRTDVPHGSHDAISPQTLSGEVAGKGASALGFFQVFSTNDLVHWAPQKPRTLRLERPSLGSDQTSIFGKAPGPLYSPQPWNEQTKLQEEIISQR